MSGVYETIETFAGAIDASGALIGLDYGTKTIGIAFSDILQSVATPQKTLIRKKFNVDAVELKALIAQNSITGLILGLPINMDGSEGPRAQSTRAFARNLAAVVNVPMCFWDERLSSVAAERALLEVDLSRAKRAHVVDSVAAAYILQGALDRLAHMRAA